MNIFGIAEPIKKLDPLSLAKVTNSLGNYSWYKEDYEFSTNYYRESLKIY